PAPAPVAVRISKRRRFVDDSRETIGQSGHMTQPSLLDGISDGQVNDLRAFAELLSGRGVDLGAVASSDRDVVWERHVLDSLRALVGLVATDETAYDLGSGGGLPGVPV